jgi:hypothetical protein
VVAGGGDDRRVFERPRQEASLVSVLLSPCQRARGRLTILYDHSHSSGVPELERLARTITRSETPILRCHRRALTNAATEGANLIVKNIPAARRFPELRQLSAPPQVALRCAAAISPSRVNTTPPPRHQRVDAAVAWAALAQSRPRKVSSRTPDTAMMTKPAPIQMPDRDGRPSGDEAG